MPLNNRVRAIERFASIDAKISSACVSLNTKVRRWMFVSKYFNLKSIKPPHKKIDVSRFSLARLRFEDISKVHVAKERIHAFAFRLYDNFTHAPISSWMASRRRSVAPDLAWVVTSN